MKITEINAEMIILPLLSFNSGNLGKKLKLKFTYVPHTLIMYIYRVIQRSVD